MIRAWRNKDVMVVRNPDAIRPWQHVLEPLSGYLLLAEKMLDRSVTGPWNFGPDAGDGLPVSDLLQLAVARLPELSIDCQGEKGPHEAATLLLDSSKAREQLGWQPAWRVSGAIEKTLDWYQAWQKGADMCAFTSEQITEYLTA